ncbi:hypothetical protein BHM03_00003692 [Ensete ventricosum]|nr:hypothetical protein BHM03_00003692 [Ensete ventricosum]
MHHHCRISSNEQRHFPYPICSRRGFDTHSPASSLLQSLFSLPTAPVRTTAHRLSVLCREGATSSFSLSNDSKSPPYRLPFCKAVAIRVLLYNWHPRRWSGSPLAQPRRHLPLPSLPKPEEATVSRSPLCNRVQLLHPHVFTDLLCRELLFHFSNRLPDLLEGAISSILPRHRSAIALRPGQIARLHRVRPCVKAARARRTATCPAASPPSAVPGGKRLLWLPFLLFVVIASLTDALQSAVDFFYGRSSTSSTVLSPLSRVTLPPFHRFAIWDVRFLVLWIDSMLPPATTSLTDKDASRGPWTEKPIVRGHGRHEARVKKMRRNRRIRRRRRGRKRNLEGPGGGGRGVGDGAERSGDRESHGRRPPSGTT